MLRKSLFLCFFIVILCLPLFVFALELQLHWPTITLPGLGTFDIKKTTRLHDVARYIYYGFVALGGIVGFIGLIMGGIKRLTAAGSLEAVSQSKKQIRTSFLGLLIILFSWLILYTLDPNLVIFHNFPEAVAIPPIEGKPKAELTDGIIFTVKNHPLLTKIEAPGGLIHVEDTRRFPVGKTYVNLSGRGGDGKVHYHPITRRILLPYISKIEIKPHSGLTGPKGNRSRYGVACFEHPHFRGEVRLFVPPLRNANFGSDDTPEFVIPHSRNLPCGSILVFKIPQPPPDSQKQDVIFYQYAFPKREKKNPITLKKEVVGECIRYYPSNPIGLCEHDARPLLPWALNYFSGDDLAPPDGLWLNEICNSLESITPDGEHWYPRSMELPSGEGAAKYIVFLFKKQGDIYHHWDRGNSYWFESGVNDFYNEKDKDKRLYWSHLPFASKEDLLPKSCIIIPVKTIY